MSLAPPNPALSVDLTQALEGTGGARSISPFPLLLMVVAVAMAATAGTSSLVAQGILSLGVGLVIVFSLYRARQMAEQQRQEQQFLREVDEQIRLGRWFDAGYRLAQAFAAPSPRPHVRFQSLIYLGSVLNHEGRYEEVERVYDHLLKAAQLPASMAFSLRCARAYAIVRQERLTDAYDTIAQLKRDPQGAASAMLVLLEMYRQVKTGHHDDALALFEAKREMLVQQLGHRSADAWALAAVAAERLGQRDQSALFARNARLLGRAGEIAHRFPECVAILTGPGVVRTPEEGAVG